MQRLQRLQRRILLSPYGATRKMSDMQDLNNLNKANLIDICFYDAPALPKQLLDFLAKGAETSQCKDCKDGYYYPLLGPREACQTCKRPHEACRTCSSDIVPTTFSAIVANRFTEHLYKLIYTQIKSHKTPGSLWNAHWVDVGCPKGQQSDLIARQAADMMFHKLTHHYSWAIAFEDVFGSELPPTNKDQIHLRSNFSGVSALISMQEINNMLQFQFQVRVSL